MFIFKMYFTNPVWYTAVISAFGRLTQEEPKFKASFGYIVTPCLKKQKQTKNHIITPKNK
jgi:hypothetical protein